MNTDLENRREDYERKHGPVYHNPCKGCPNFEVVEDEAGKYAYCLIGEENCDQEDE